VLTGSNNKNIFVIGGTPMLGKRFLFDVDIVMGGGIVPDKAICRTYIPYPDKAICSTPKPVVDKHTRIIYEVYPLQPTPYSPPP